MTSHGCGFCRIPRFSWVWLLTGLQSRVSWDVSGLRVWLAWISKRSHSHGWEVLLMLGYQLGFLHMVSWTYYCMVVRFQREQQLNNKCSRKLKWRFFFLTSFPSHLVNQDKVTESSLVGQKLGICPPMQGPWVWYLAWEDSTCHGAMKSMHHNYWSPCALEPTLPNKRSNETQHS